MKSAVAALALVAACASPAAVTSDAAPADAGVPADVRPSPFVWTHATTDFGYVSIGSAGALTQLVVNNTASGAIDDFAIELGGDDTDEFLISQTTCTSTITDGCSLTVGFAPRAAGDHTLAVSAIAPGYAPATATIHAIAGSPPPGLSTDSNRLDGGSVIVGSSADKVVTFRNLGTATLMPIAFVLAGEAPEAWRLDDDHCSGQQLPVSGACTVDLVYTPTDISDPGTATLLATAAPITLELDLRAGPAPATTIAVSPTSSDFGVAQAPAGATVPFTVTNTGNAPAIGFTVRMFNAQYAVASTTCTASLAPGASCVESIQLVPTTPGADPGGMDIGGGNVGFTEASFTAVGIPAEGVILDTYSHDFGSAHEGTIGDGYTFTVTNVGTSAATISYSYDDAQSSFPITQDNCSTAPLAANATCTFSITYEPQPGDGDFARVHVTTASDDAIAVLTGTRLPPLDMPAQLFPGDQDYGNWVVGIIQSATFSVQNPGAMTKTFTAALTGADADEFAFGANGCAGVAVPMSGSCEIEVLYKPLTAGSKMAMLEVTWATGTVAASLEATAYVDPNALVISDPMAYDFGPVAIGQTASVTIPFTNRGAMTSPPVAFAFDDPMHSQFSLTADACTGAALATNASCMVTLTFAPTSAGAIHDDLYVTSSELTDLKLSGTGQ